MRVSVYLIVFLFAALASALIHRCVLAVVASASGSVVRWSVRGFAASFSSHFSLFETVAGLARRHRSVLFPPLFLCLRSACSQCACGPVLLAIELHAGLSLVSSALYTAVTYFSSLLFSLCTIPALFCFYGRHRALI